MAGSTAATKGCTGFCTGSFSKTWSSTDFFGESAGFSGDASLAVVSSFGVFFGDVESLWPFDSFTFSSVSFAKKFY